ncbi:hypothetical protein [Streptomyces boluensis]|uniref:Uncharacterized protein n=1 Tax=Streptomyces boluensis TaxID=1775135 RepID=A0A964UND6_9ACTN|nr:hypothetical protein [Streptomyces boluensis]NBE52241.1 hypothetical protein [Streptomyces boluensis]
MTPRLRSRLRTAGLLALLAVPVATVPGGSGYVVERAYAHTLPATASPASSSPSPEESRAGSRAGEGRVRPGRTQPEPVKRLGGKHVVPPAHPVRPKPPSKPDEPNAPASPSPARTEPPPAADAAREAAEQTVPGNEGPLLRVLPLGLGLLLIGLGLAFLALRLRRG